MQSQDSRTAMAPDRARARGRAAAIGLSLLVLAVSTAHAGSYLLGGGGRRLV